jgi:hypothetical protein
LIRTYIEIETPYIKAAGSFLAHAAESIIEVTHSKLKTPRKLLRIEFSKLGTLLLENDIKLFYDPFPIAKLQHGISKALARYCLSHKNQPNGGWKLDALLKTILGDGSKSQDVRNAKRRIKQDAEQLKKSGITIKNDRVFLLRNPETPKPIEK